MDTKLYYHFLKDAEQMQERRFAHSSAAAGIPGSAENPLPGAGGLPLQQGADMMAAASDPDGSYTGVPVEPYETPQQDADDL